MNRPRLYNPVKRAIDCCLSFCSLILFSPLFLVCYIAIKLVDKGPAIYKQERIGLGGKPFYIYKFRTMVVDAEKEGEELLQTEDDPRLTKTGKFLRRHHLDELPQLWNVLKGDMAFIGPRPERQYYINKIMEQNPRYAELYQIRPGVTSYATLHNGYADTLDKMLARLEMDLHYLEHLSLWMDAKLLLSTFFSIVSGRVFTLLATTLLTATMATAQDTLRTSLTYDLTAEAAAGTGDFTAFQLSANRHHVLATRPNTAYLRGALNLEHPFTADLRLSAAVDAIASVHADHRAYLQQCYANLSYDAFFIEVGSRELKPVLRDEQLSAGSFVRGNNAKPIPKVHVGTNGFWTVPLTKQWLQVDIDFGYGKFLDSGYREDGFYAARDVNPIYATGIYLHQKHVYLRTNPEKPIYFTGGIEHAVQFGGTGFSYVDGVLTAKTKPADLKAFVDVITNKGNSNYVDNDLLEDWRYGNHVGQISVQLSWNIDRSHRLHAYLDDPFEDGSGMRKANGWDGLWGLAYENKDEGNQWVRRAVVEYLQTTNQCGPLHWNPTDHPEPIRSQISNQTVGNDNYYNHMFYHSFSHYGMTPGIGLITSPIYNKDGYTAFRDNRIKAWNVGLTGEVGCGLSYLVKGSYQEGWGTYAIPLAEKHHSLDAMVQGTYTQGPWQMSAAYAFDKGNIYGDCSTFNLKISYHGKIL